MTQETKIQFLQYMKPALESGAFRVTVTQEFASGKGGGLSPQQELTFYVQGHRFQVPPAEIHAVYPPNGAFNTKTAVLPHLSLRNATFPWERSAVGGDDKDPWVALLLFEEQEMTEEKVVRRVIPVQEFVPPIALEVGQKPKDPVTIIEVKRDLLRQVMPEMPELKMLTHVRRRTSTKDGKSTPGLEVATVLGNRLPAPGKSAHVFLVSLENRYQADGKFDFGSRSTVQLIVLHEWSFTNDKNQGKEFEQLSQELALGTLALPRPDSHERAAAFLRRGYVPLKHHFRNGERSYSWYHSPWSPLKDASELHPLTELPAYGDHLLQYYADIGMLDVSYAAAFELGRSLALEDQVFARDLAQWKNAYNVRLFAEQNVREAQDAVAFAENNAAQALSSDRGAKITGWLKELYHFAELPFNYLVPDERLLPDESIRFLRIDQSWMYCLMAGAFSLGPRLRDRNDDEDSPRKAFATLIESLHPTVITGFLLRSEIVDDYPDLQISAYPEVYADENALPDSAKPLDVHAIERIGPGILLALFEGEVRTTELYLKPEGLHFGFDPVNNADEQLIGLEKSLLSTLHNVEMGLPFRSPEKRVLNLTSADKTGIADQMAAVLSLSTDPEPKTDAEPFTSADFGLYMADGSSKARFLTPTK